MSRNKNQYVIICCMCLLLLSACGKTIQVDPSTQVMEIDQENDISTTSITKGTFCETTSVGKGGVTSFQEQGLSFTSDGATLLEIYVEKGDSVKKGQELAKFTIVTSPSKLEEKKILMDRGKETYLLGVKQKKEQIRIEENKLTSLTEELDVEIQKIQITKLLTELQQYQLQQERQLKQLEHEYDTLKEMYSTDMLYAPFDGIIQRVENIEVGELVSSKELFVISAPSHQVIYFENNGFFHYNMKVIVTAGRKGEEVTYKGRVIASMDLFEVEDGLRDILPQAGVSNIVAVEVEDKVYLDKGIPITVTADKFSIDNVMLVDSTLTKNEKGLLYVDVLRDGVIYKQYFQSGGSNREKVWVLSELNIEDQIVKD